MGKYAKFFVAAGGVGLLIAMQRFGVTIPGFSDIVRDLIVGALVAGSVYQVPNSPAN